MKLFLVKNPCKLLMPGAQPGRPTLRRHETEEELLSVQAQFVSVQSSCECGADLLPIGGDPSQT